MIEDGVYESAVKGRAAFRSAVRAYREEIAEARRILAGTDIGSLPHDYPLIQMVRDRMRELEDKR